MKICLFVLAIMLSAPTIAQQKPAPTDVIIVKGRVKAEQHITLADLQAMPVRNIGDVMITNHLGQPKGTAKAMKGVSLKDVLAKTDLETDNPKLNSTYYFVFTASDGYKVVYSWNELLNNQLGSRSFVVTEKEGKKLSEMEERILVITPGDDMTGRRYVKGLSTIQVERVQ